jgi:type-F conjugative transfer system secretin TraK
MRLKNISLKILQRFFMFLFSIVIKRYLLSMCSASLAFLTFLTFLTSLLSLGFLSVALAQSSLPDTENVADDHTITDQAVLLAAMDKQGQTNLFSGDSVKKVEENQANASSDDKRKKRQKEQKEHANENHGSSFNTVISSISPISSIHPAHDFNPVTDSAYRSSLKPTDAELIGFSSNQTLTVRLSKADTNRLYVQGDKIIDFTCQQGFCFVDRGRLDKTGDVLLTLGNAARLGTGFTAFVLTESGRQFTLYGVPEVSGGKTIGFISQGGASLQASALEKKTPYRTLVVSLIRSMMNYAHTGTLPEGYVTVAIEKDGQGNQTNEVDELKVKQGFSYQPVRIFKGGILTGIVYAIQNFNGHSITLHPKAFYQKGMVAGALSKEQLASGEVGYFYALIQEGASDV